MSSSPSLTVLVNNYNYAQYLRECIDSALVQLRDGDELVVVDDGSTDDSHAVLEAYRAMGGVRIVKQENSGQVGALVRGIEESNREVVVLLDSDDSFIPGYLDRLRSIYRRNPDVRFVAAHPVIQGDDLPASRSVRITMTRMMFPTGPVGSTLWATRCFSEYVGVPTSGLSLRLSLARELSPLMDTLRHFDYEQSAVAKLLARFGVSLPISQFGADGLLVRYASLLGANKYYDAEPGFNYRIHGSNRFGRLPYWQRQYQRHARVVALSQKLDEQGFPARPTTLALQQEFMERSFPTNFRRRALLKLRYAVVVPRSRGTLVEKCRALLSIPGAGKTGQA